MESKKDLIRLLQNAHAGERAAAFAYRGHSLAVTTPRERKEIQKIEQEEWDHRACLFQMLQALNAKPRLSREILMMFIGACIYSLCRFGGWFNIFNFGWYMSMFGAGKLEQVNIIEYEVVAISAQAHGESRFIDDLINMAEVEWDHEFYFRSKAMTSKWSCYIKIWNAPPPRHSTRQTLTMAVSGGEGTPHPYS